MVADRAKKLKVAADQDSDHIDQKLVQSVENLQELQDQLDKIDVEASDEVVEIEQKYNEIKRPVYARRDEIIKCIPDFWLIAFQSHPVLGELLIEEDQKVFKYLDSIEVEEFNDDYLGYSINFNFKSNPYFENTKLTKSFTFLDKGTTKITGTAISWKEGMGTANGNTDEKKGNKHLLLDESFFNWLSETKQKNTAEGHDEVAEIIKEELWPNPLKYFSNEADEEDSDEDADDDEEVDDEEEDDDEDSDEDDN